MSEAENLSLTGRFVIGGLAISGGIIPALAFFDIGPADRADIMGPAWLGLAAGGAFIFSGLAIFFKDTVLQHLFGAAVLLSLAALGTWVGFGGGERICGVGSAEVFSTPSFYVSGFLCRAPFAYGALLLDSVLLMLFVSKLQEELNDNLIISVVYKILGTIFFILILPLIIITLLPKIAPDLYQSIKSYLTSDIYSREDRATRKEELKKMFNERFHKNKR